MKTVNEISVLLQRVTDKSKPAYLWKESDAFVVLYEIFVGSKKGAVLYYQNPPVHAVSTKILCAMENTLELVNENTKDFKFLVLWSASLGK